MVIKILVLDLYFKDFVNRKIRWNWPSGSNFRNFHEDIFLSMHCCYCIYKNVLSFFAYLYKSITVEPEKYKEKVFWALKVAEKIGESLGFEPMTLSLQ